MFNILKGSPLIKVSSFFVSCDIVFFFKQKTAYEMRISDWSSDVCSSDLRFPESDGWSHGWSGLGNGNSVMAAFRRPATLYVCLAFINFPLLDFDLKKPEIEIPTHELGKLAHGWVGEIGRAHV